MKSLLTAMLVMVTSVGSTASNVVIIDGDTIAVGHERIRILSIDTPETFHSRCKNELVLGLRAKERLRELLDSGDIRIERDGQDRYRRTLANVFADDVDVGETLIREGYALRYEPGGEAKLRRLQTWCGPDATLEEGSRRTGITRRAERYRSHRHPATGEWPTNARLYGYLDRAASFVVRKSASPEGQETK